MAESYRIRELGKTDLPAAMQLVWEVFCQFEAPEYAPEGVAEFQRSIELARIEEKLARGEAKFWGCWAGEELAGVTATRSPCHISLLFVRRDWHRRGIGRALYETVRDYYLRQGEQQIMTVNSSPYAVGVYEKLGFRATDSERVVNGIRFTPMENKFR